MKKSAPKSGTIQVDGLDFAWSVFRQPRWTNHNGYYALLGLSILVQAKDLNHRELLLEFSIDRNKHGDMPQHQRFNISDRRLGESIRNAIDAGWDPDSRGKRFVFDAGSVNLS